MKPQVIFVFSVIVLILISCAKNNEAELPQLRTLDIFEITSTTAKSGGFITASGNSEIIKKGLVWGRIINPSIDGNGGISYGGTGSAAFFNVVSGLTPNTTYFLRAYATNRSGTSYGQQLSFKTLLIPEVITDSITIYSKQFASGGGDVTSEGSSPVIERGIAYGNVENPTIYDSIVVSGSGKGRFIAVISEIRHEISYYVRAYATNSYGTAYGKQVGFIIAGPSYPYRTHHCAKPLVLEEVINPKTGKTWMDRNLWAVKASELSDDAASYGDLYQWGRKPDLHQCRISGAISDMSSRDIPQKAGFILTSSHPHNWRHPQNTKLWQGTIGNNNPCPNGFRVPTEAELDSERLSWSSFNASGALASPLKMPLAGTRSHIDGSIENAGFEGNYWSSTIDGYFSRYLRFDSSLAGMQTDFRAKGNSVRCIKN